MIVGSSGLSELEFGGPERMLADTLVYEGDEPGPRSYPVALRPTGLVLHAPGERYGKREWRGDLTGVVGNDRVHAIPNKLRHRRLIVLNDGKVSIRWRRRSRVLCIRVSRVPLAY